MKFVDLLNVSVTMAAGVLTPGTAQSGGRTLVQAMADGDVALTDTTLSIVVTDGASRELGLYNVGGTAQAPTLMRTQVLRNSAGGTTAVAFAAGATLTAYSDVPASFLNGGNLGSLNAATNIPDTYVMHLFDPATGTDYKATVAALKAVFGTGASGSSPTVASVTVSPSTASVLGAGTQAFTAAVTGTNSPAQTVTWTASAGSITTGGVFTAPAATSSAQTITITATSTADTSKSGTATVTVAASGSTVTGITVSPATASLVGAGTQTFTAVVAGTNSPSQAVNWTSTAGSITSGGVFTAPVSTASVQTITITATSAQDGTKAGTATVTVAAATVTGVTVSPSAPSVSGAATQQFTATVAGTNNPPQNVTWGATAGSISVGGLFTAPASTSSAQTITITATSTLDGTKSGTATVTVPATAPAMASLYRLTNANSAGLTLTSQAMTADTGDYRATLSSTRVNIRTADGLSAPAATQVKLFWGKAGLPCAVTFASPTLPANSTNGNTQARANAISTVNKLSGWADGATSNQYYGTFVADSLYAWTDAPPHDVILWVLYSDGSSKAYDNNTGTPLTWSLT